MTNSFKYYVTEPGFENLMNAGILRLHNESILASAGFKRTSFKDNLIAGCVQVLEFAFKIRPGSLVIFHFPLHSRKNKWLLAILSLRKIKTAVIIVDIDGLRDGDEALLQRELILLKKFNVLVAHNEAMKNYLLQFLPTASIVCINIFDYCTKANPAVHSLSPTVCFAGNLVKSSFIYQVKDVDLNLYGKGFDQNQCSSNLHFKGAYTAEELPTKLEGSFGLVWDGVSAEECDGYLAFNNPHKFSLYLAAGLPVIAWEGSAIAPIIHQLQVGFTVSSLNGLGEKVEGISLDVYYQMQSNALKISEQIRTGYFLKAIIQQLTN